MKSLIPNSDKSPSAMMWINRSVMSGVGPLRDTGRDYDLGDYSPKCFRASSSCDLERAKGFEPSTSALWQGVVRWLGGRGNSRAACNAIRPFPHQRECGFRRDLDVQTLVITRGQAG